MTPLRKWMIDELVRRNYDERTIKTYVAAVAAIAKRPDGPGESRSGTGPSLSRPCVKV